jgi:hypothetical protein
MLKKLINQFSAFLPAFEFRPTLARFIFHLPARIYPKCQHSNPNDNFGIKAKRTYHCVFGIRKYVAKLAKVILKLLLQ